MRSVVGPGSGRVRMAKLVAALSLGVDLGFGQPMEHVLRQCMMALPMSPGGHELRRREGLRDLPLHGGAGQRGLPFGRP